MGTFCKALVILFCVVFIFLLVLCHFIYIFIRFSEIVYLLLVSIIINGWPCYGRLISTFSEDAVVLLASTREHGILAARYFIGMGRVTLLSQAVDHF